MASTAVETLSSWEGVMDDESAALQACVNAWDKCYCKQDQENPNPEVPDDTCTSPNAGLSADKVVASEHIRVSKRCVSFSDQIGITPCPAESCDPELQDTTITLLSCESTELVSSEAMVGNRATQTTNDITLLSTAHGKARRALRGIKKHELKAAVKYGEKERGYPCRKTGLPRWKYTFADVVYITDHTSKEEVTSYRVSVEIERAEITPERMQWHQNSVENLKYHPEIYVTHSILIIDQSGSMKTSDVAGFRTRSEAAYGTLALDYVAQQLYARKETDFTSDVVSVIEMHDTSEIVIDNQPLDWVLFNALLDRRMPNHVSMEYMPTPLRA